MDKRLRVLIVEDSPNDCELLVHELERGGYDVTHDRVQTADAMTAALGQSTWDVVLSDYSMPTFSGLAALTVLQATGHDVPFLIVSGTIGEETAVAALKAGAHDYLVKGRLARLLPAVERALREAVARRDRVRLESRLRHAQKLESLGQLAGGIAHDFNNVLTAILGFSELLLDDFEPGDRRAADVSEIKKAGESGQRLTRQLLAFSRQQPLEPTRLDLNAVLATTEGILQQLLGKRVRLETVLGSSLGSVWADAGQVQQVLINLTVNARDAMPDGGCLRIETYVVSGSEVQSTTTQDVVTRPHVVLGVTDTGVGMSPETTARIFEPFFTTKSADEGTGLGLSTVYGIVRQSGGVIDVNSTVGQGTTFRIFLPQLESAQATVGR